MSSKATEDALALLHAALANSLKDKLASGEATAADLNVVRQFLKDNGIDCYGKANPDVASLAEKMNFPVEGDDDDPTVIQFRP